MSPCYPTPMKLFRLQDPRAQMGHVSGWLPGSGSTILASSKYGAIVHGVVDSRDEHGRRITYDQPVFLEPGGAIIVPECIEDGTIAFVRIQRPVMSPPGVFLVDSEYPSPQTGRDSLELPRGFAEPGESGISSAMRELQEELGVRADGDAIKLLGHTNSNTTFFAASVPIYLARVSRSAAKDTRGHEGIRAVSFLNRSQIMQRVAEDGILCGMTKSALLTYFAYQARL